MKIYEVNEEEKYYDYIKGTDFILLNFDLLNRDSYEDIDSRWKNYIIKQMEYTKKVYLLGNYKKKEEHLTDRKEIDDLLSDENIKIDYFEIGGFTDEELVKFFDNRILMALQDKMNNKDDDKNKAGSCLIF